MGGCQRRSEGTGAADRRTRLSSFAARAATIAGIGEEQIERLAGGDLSDVLLLRRADGRCTVAKRAAVPGTEAAMLREIAAAGAPVPTIEAEYDDILLLEHVPNDAVLSVNAWADLARRLSGLHAHSGDRYGWPVDYRLGTVTLDNRWSSDWADFWGQQRLLATAAVLDRGWRQRIEALVAGLGDLLPRQPRPALLHGDLWTGNILVRDGTLAAFIDPACCYGDIEVDLAMLSLFDAPPDEFWSAYGELEAGWEQRRPIYQLFPLLVHLRLFGASYEAAVDRTLQALGR